MRTKEKSVFQSLGESQGCPLFGGERLLSLAFSFYTPSSHLLLHFGEATESSAHQRKLRDTGL